ncbi:hypothetical protein C5613_22040 [Rhodococcus opacus]|uniref:Uncharacterized protein n=1 Tax=Rhodococcus opacus TaxID=37919 RepID=A0A2S8J6Y5_RHOOP|nr:hypothetical protein C5613_22040 [Rhodococcus opacus]
MGVRLSRAVTTPTGCPSSPPCGSPDDRCPTVLFPPHNHTAVIRLWDQGIAKLLRRVNPVRRLRANPRVVKRKVLKWAAKRGHHQHHPQPTQSPICTILVH